MRRSVQTYWNGDARHPDVFFVRAVGHPEVAVFRCAVALLDATHILRTVALELSAMTQGHHVAVNQRERIVIQSVAAEADSQWPTVFRRVIDRGVGTVAQPLSPYLGVAVHQSGSTVGRLAPGVSAVGRDTGEGMFPQAHLPAVGQGIAAESLQGRLEGQDIVAAVTLLGPLHALHGVRNQGIHSLYQILVLGLFVVGIVGVLLAETVVVVDEIDGTERAVLLDFAHHASDAVAVVGVVLHRLADAIVADGQQFAVGRHIPAHPLVHHGLQIMRRGQGGTFLAEAFRHVVFGEQLHGFAPCVAVFRSLQHGLSRCFVLMAGVGQVVHIEASVPVGHHRLVVIGPRFLAAQGLDVMHADGGLQSAVVSFGTGNGRSGIAHTVAVVFLQVLHQLLVGHEYRAVLMANGEAHAARLVLEGLEVLRAVGTVDFMAVRVVVDVVPVAHLCRRGTFGK